MAQKRLRAVDENWADVMHDLGGTGVLWTVSGGIPHSVGLIGEALAADPTGFTFLQMSDSHIGFNKPANPYALGTLHVTPCSEGKATARSDYLPEGFWQLRKSC